MKIMMMNDGNMKCEICDETFDANGDWMMFNYKEHMIVHARRGEHKK
jgi:hypothetical protein